MIEGLNPSNVQEIYNRASRRYDWYHGAVTLTFDEQGRRLVVARGVRPGDKVLDAGGGTGSTALHAGSPPPIRPSPKTGRCAGSPPGSKGRSGGFRR